jgi:hypothetical protein
MAKGKGKGISGGGLKAGLTRKAPSASDKSTRLPTSTSVNKDATRSSVSRATNNLGPRNA